MPEHSLPPTRYGQEERLPSTWEGWLVLAAYLGLMVGAEMVCAPEKNMARFVAAVFGFSAGLVAICWWKGEPVRWRWG